MYEAVTHGIHVRVEPQYLEAQSAPAQSRFFWAYTIEIENRSDVTVRLRARYWHITDANGRVQEVRGAGVVGETPTLKQGQVYSYTSGCPLGTPSGIMVGHYEMVDEAGKTFNIAIPAFSLDSPHARRTIN